MAASCGKCDLNFVEPDDGPEEACSCPENTQSPIARALEIISLKEWEHKLFTLGIQLKFDADEWEEEFWESNPGGYGGVDAYGSLG
jgi:hypothetical protein